MATEQTLPQENAHPIIFGEVLFDRFPDGNDILGGAPFNVAWHLQGFGLRPHVISRIGDDTFGRRVTEAMARWSMDTRGLQRDPDHATGVVQIEMRGDSHSFDILPERAYDFIDAAQALDHFPANPAPLLYFGTLATRHPVSRNALQSLREHCRLPAFVDINLRAPWWNMERVEDALGEARWIKLNDEELLTITGRSGSDAIEEAARELFARFRPQWLIVTLGADGALLYDGERMRRAAPPPLEQITDTVGAGDAFSAVVILGLLARWPAGQVLERALAFAAAICRVRGATTDDTELYQRYLTQWEE